MFGEDKNKKEKKKIGILSILIVVVVVETNWGIAQGVFRSILRMARECISLLFA
jgi:hypothetical protein